MTSRIFVGCRPTAVERAAPLKAANHDMSSENLETLKRVSNY